MSHLKWNKGMSDEQKHFIFSKSKSKLFISNTLERHFWMSNVLSIACPFMYAVSYVLLAVFSLNTEIYYFNIHDLGDNLMKRLKRSWIGPMLLLLENFIFDLEKKERSLLAYTIKKSIFFNIIFRSNIKIILITIT